MTFWDAFAKFPPYYVRLLAKRPGNSSSAALSDAEVAIAAGLSINRVREISRLMSWDTLTFSELNAFSLACNFDPTNYIHRNRESQYRYVCKLRCVTPFAYLRKHPKWESEFLPLVRMLSAQFSSVRNPSAPVHA